MLKRPLKLLLSLALVLTMLAPAGPAAAEGRRIRLIRDAEIENIIRAYATPVFSAAQLDASAIKIHIIDDRQLNAFVTEGQNMFFHTGLLTRVDTPGQLIGVIAHETGHIARGHLTRLDDAFRRAQITSIVTMILGAAAMAASGQGGPGVAIIGAGQGVAMRSFLKFTRTQERAADQFAVNILDQTGQSSRGMLEFFKILQGQEFLVTNRQDPYVRSHPLTSDRIEFLRNHVANSPFADTPPSPRLVRMHRRMRGKLIGYLAPLQEVFRRYKDSDTSVESRYARAIAYHRESRTAKALALIDSLIAEAPDDPYFHELRGQIVFESGGQAKALPSYERAVRLLPNSSLLRTSLAAVQLEIRDPALVRPALAHLNESVRIEPDLAQTWRLLATAHGRLGNRPMVALSLAEEALLLHRYGDAIRLAKRVIAKAPAGSTATIRAQDIERVARRAKQG